MGPSMSMDGVGHQAARGPAGQGAASMGPSMSIDGVRWITSATSARSAGFNGAVDEHRRSHERQISAVVLQEVASMGPSMSIDGVRGVTR